MGACTAHPFHAASPHGLLRAPYTRERVRAPCHRGVHHGLISLHQGMHRTAEGLVGPEQHISVRVARAALALAGGAGGSYAGIARLTTMAWCEVFQSPYCRFPPRRTRLQRGRTQHTPPSRLPVPMGGHPGLCPLVRAPSAHYTTTHHATLGHATHTHTRCTGRIKVWIRDTRHAALRRSTVELGLCFWLEIPWEQHQNS